MNQQLLIKVCGLTLPDQMEELDQMGVDYLGMIFYPKSARNIQTEPDRWEEIQGTRIGVFVNAEIRDIMHRLAQYGLKGVQLHGDESPSYVAELKSFWPMTIIKAFSVDESFDFSETQAYEGLCHYFLFDTKGKQRGGNGHTFNWSLLEQYQGNTPFFLSGGLSPDSLEALQSFQHPNWRGVDLNSGFEVEPGVKDLEKVKAFVEAFHRMTEAES